MNKRKEQAQLAKAIGIFIGVMLAMMTVNTCRGQCPNHFRGIAADARKKVNSADTVKTIYLKRWTLRDWKRYYRKHKNDKGFKAFLKWYKNKEQ